MTNVAKFEKIDIVCSLQTLFAAFHLKFGNTRYSVSYPNEKFEID